MKVTAIHLDNQPCCKNCVSPCSRSFSNRSHNWVLFWKENTLHTQKLPPTERSKSRRKPSKRRRHVEYRDPNLMHIATSQLILGFRFCQEVLLIVAPESRNYWAQRRLSILRWSGNCASLAELRHWADSPESTDQQSTETAFLLREIWRSPRATRWESASLLMRLHVSTVLALIVANVLHSCSPYRLADSRSS